MTSMAHHWAETPTPRDQMALFSPTLDDAISQDHPVRLLDEILRRQDWSAWVTPCSDHRGRPPIHPRVLAAVILYGLMRRIRSSRMLEYMCGHNVDFLWLAEGHCPDHSTLSGFRKESGKALKGLFRQVGRLAMAMGLVQLVEVAFDGTRVKANASRYHTWTVAKVEAALKELDGLFDRMMAEADQAEAHLPAGLSSGESMNHLPAELATLEQRRQKLQEILQTLQAQDTARRKQGKNPEKNPAQLPKADRDAKVMPNKEGGYAANFTPTAAVDVSSDMIVDCEVIADPNEHAQTLPAVDRIEENFGRKPEAFLADTAHGTGENLEGMEQRNVTFFTPMESSQPQEGNPARRDDPSQPVTEADWPRLPRNAQKQLDKSCFIYAERSDRYYCPQGRVLEYVGIQKDTRNGQAIAVRVYRCGNCDNCPLNTACRSPKAQRGRMIYRDEYEPLREVMAARMQTAAGRAIYARRMHGAETPFAHIKGVMGVRQFLLRGLENVRTEWRWVCTAFNLNKLLKVVVALRAHRTQGAVEAVG
jgi:transposase